MQNIIIETYQNETNDEIKQAMIEEWLNEAHYNEQLFDQLITLADEYLILGHPAFSLMIYLRLQTIDPNDQLVYRIAKSYAHIYEYEEALRWYQLLPENVRTNEHKMEEAEWLIAIKNEELARSILNQLIQDEPTFAPPYFKLAEMYELNGDLSRAIYFVQAVFDYFTEDSVRQIARQRLVSYKLQQENIDLNEIQRLLFDDTLPVIDSMDYYLLAKMYQLANDISSAIDASRQALALDENNSSAGLLFIELTGEVNNDSDFRESLQWFEEKIPESEMSPLEIAQIAAQKQQLDSEIIQRLEGYLAYTSDEQEQYDIISMVLSYYLDKENFEAFNQFLNEQALGYFMDEELGYFIGKYHYLIEEYHLAIPAFEAALDYLVSEFDVVELLMRSLEAVGRDQEAKLLANKYNNSDYGTEYIQKIVEEQQNESR